MRRTTLAALAALSISARAQEVTPEMTPEVTPIVNVTATRAAVVRKLDKTVYDVAAMPRADNGTAQDVLQSTPELSVTADGRIAVKGNAQVTVLVDGKPTAMLSGSADERAVALQTMNGADIASIEVITNPSAAYNANGGAIVNIVMKRDRKPGAHGRIQGSASDHGLFNIGGSGDATGKDVSVHARLALRHDGNLKLRDATVERTDPVTGALVQTRQSSEVFVHRVVTTAALGADYTLGASDSVSVQTNYNERRSRPLFDVLDDNRSGADATIFHRISLGPNTQSDGSASLSYSHQDAGAALTAMVQHSDTTGVIDKSYLDVYVAPLLPTDASHGATRTGRRLNQATLDWSAPSHAGKWGAGVDLQDRVDTIANYQATVDQGVETPDPATTNGYAVQATTQAAYVTDMLKWERWELLLGGRAERTALQVDAAPAAHWQAFNPSLNLRYAASGQLDLTLNYRRSLQLPDPRDLNPNTTYIDAQNVSRGNPALQPQRLTSWELGANDELGTVTANAGLFYRTSANTVTDARSVEGLVLVTSKQNGGQARSAGVTGGLEWTPDQQLHAGLDAGVYRVQLATPDGDLVVRQFGTAGHLNLRAGYKLGHDDIALDAHGQSAAITPLGHAGATSNVNLSWRHAISKTLSLSVNANDIFDGSRRTWSTRTSTFHQSGSDHFLARRLYVGLVQKFD